MTTDTSEKGLETLIIRHMTGTDGLAVAAGSPAERPDVTGSGYFAGSPRDFDRANAIDVPQLFAFLRATQPDWFKALGMADADNPNDINRKKFLARLSNEIGKRGVIDLLRKGVEHGPVRFDLFYGTPSEGNARATALNELNRFSITRQLAYSMDETRRALDLAVAPRIPSVVEFVRERLRFQPDARQAEVLESKARQGILNCSRQWGKSTVSVAKALHRAHTAAGCLVLVASPGERQSAEWMRKAREMARPLLGGSRARGDGDNQISLLLPNGSRIVGLPGTDGTVRGFSAVSLLLIDEASRVEDSMYRALRPMLAVSNGDVWLMSTPYGRRGFFYEAWEHGGEEWFRVHGPAMECGRIGAEFLERERNVMGALGFRQGYLGEFVDNGAGLFDREVVEAALDENVRPLVVG